MLNKVTINYDRTSSTYSLRVHNEDGTFTSTVLSTVPGEPYTLKLPENPSNRKYFNSKKVDAAGGEIELTYKESKHFGARTNGSSSTSTAPKKALKEYLNDEDKAIFEALIAKAVANRTKELELAKAKAAYEKALAELNALTGEAE